MDAGLDVHGPKIGGGLDIKAPKIGLPKVDIDINAPKIGGGLDLHGPKIGGGIDIQGPQISSDIKLTPPPKEIPTIEIKNPSINVSLNKPDSSVSGQGFLPSLKNIIDSQGPDVEFAPKINIEGTNEPPKVPASFSVKVEATDPSLSINDTGKEASVKGTALLNNLISSEDKNKPEIKVGGKISKKIEVKPPKVAPPKLSQKDLHVGIGLHGKAADPKLKISVGTTSGKTKPKIKASQPKVKDVKLPAKIIKMKDLISQQYKDPIHDVKEIPRFEIYKK